MKIRNIFKTIALSSLVVISACSDDFLDETPSDSVPVDVSITNENGVLNALYGAYDGMQQQTGFGNYIITIQALLGDNGFVSLTNSNRFTDFNDYTFTSVTNGSVSSFWTRFYRIIGRANNILSYEGDIAEDSGVDGTVEQKFAEAKIIRAFSLFEAVNFFARPDGTTSQELGIMLPLVFEPSAQLARSTVDEVYAQIEKDLSEAITTLDGYNPGKQRLGYDAAVTLMSRVKLYEKEYSDAITYADLAINSSYSTLLPMSSVESYYTAGDQAETIFEVEFTSTDNIGSNDALFATWGLGGTYEQSFATQEFVDIIPSTDVRLALYPEVTGYSDNPAPRDMKKYPSVDTDVVYLRKTEAMLNKIEATYFSDESSAQTMLNDWVSTYRDPSYSTSATGQDLLDEILQQRRIEFAFEGQRLFDLNRYELSVEKGANCTNNCSIPFSDYRRVLQIPDYEIRNNPNAVQNPGY